MGKRTGRPRGPWPLKGYRDALRLAAFRRLPDGRTTLEVIAERVVLRAMSGDAHAIRHIAERLDGRVRSRPRSVP